MVGGGCGKGVAQAWSKLWSRRGFHKVTLVDMGDTAGPDVSMALLRLQWPVPVVSWLQPELEQLRHTCKKQYRGSQADGCSFCGKKIKLDIGRHDSDEESPRCKARRARSPHKVDVPAVPILQRLFHLGI